MGSWGNFAKFVEWVLVNCGSRFIICPAEEDITSPAPDLEPSQPSTLASTDFMPEPMEQTKEPMPEPYFALKPEANGQSMYQCTM